MREGPAHGRASHRPQPPPRKVAGRQRIHPPMRRSSTKRLPGRLSAFQASAGQPAPVVRGLFPARHSLPWPKAGLRDQATRARTTGKPVPPAGFGASPNAAGDVSPSLVLRVPVSAGDGPSPPSRSQNRCPAKMHTPSRRRHASTPRRLPHGLDRRLPGRGLNLWRCPRQ